MLGSRKSFLPLLQSRLATSFSIDELRELCLILGVGYEDLVGETRSAKASELILLLARHERLPELLDTLRELRPNTSWPPLPSDFKLEDELLRQSTGDYAGANSIARPVNVQGDNIEIGDIGAGAQVAVGRSSSIDVRQHPDQQDSTTDQHDKTGHEAHRSAGDQSQRPEPFEEGEMTPGDHKQARDAADTIQTGHVGRGATVVAGRNAVAKIINNSIQITTQWLPAVILLLAIVIVLAILLIRSNQPEREEMTGMWNVAVAGFAAVGDEAVSQEEADTISLVFFNRLQPDLEELEEANRSEITIDVRDPKKTGRIEGESPEERAAQAKKLADEIYAHVVIYGTISRTDNLIRIQPEFFVNMENNFDTMELAGQHAFGDTLLRIRGVGDPLSEIRLNNELARRAQILTLMVGGLTRYVINHHQQALELFRSANDTNAFWANSDDGRELVHQLLGNTLKALGHYDQAADAYQDALDVDPEYARAYLGLGDIYYLRALEGGSDGEISYDRALLDEAMALFERALLAEKQPPFADVPAKASFYQGEVLVARLFDSQLKDKQAKEEATEKFHVVIEARENEAGDRLNEFASEAHARIGLMEIAFGNRSQALESYLRAEQLALDPGRKALFAARAADLYKENGQLEDSTAKSRDAIEGYKSALEPELGASPEVRAGYMAGIANRYLHLEQYNEAVDYLERAIELFPDESESIERQLVRETIQEALRILPDDPELRLRLESLADALH